jgi:tRNA threonylcarbamoyladenosine biosynthesis protein TsaE
LTNEAKKMNKKIEIEYCIKELDKAAKKVFPLLTKGALFLIEGDLGAGKTTLIKKLIEFLTKKDCFCGSPTFTYLNSYKDTQGTAINHFDLYRINNYKELEELGLIEIILDQKAITFVEWPKDIEDKITELKSHRLCFKLDLKHNFKKNNRTLMVRQIEF